MSNLDTRTPRPGDGEEGVAARFIREIDNEIALIERRLASLQARLAEIRDLKARVVAHGDGSIHVWRPSPALKVGLSRRLVGVLSNSPSLTVKEILDRLRAQGYGAGRKERNVYHSVWEALNDQESRFVRNANRRWSLRSGTMGDREG